MKDTNGKMEFSYQFNAYSPKITMILSPESDLVEILETFKAFLQAAGYYFDGEVIIDGNTKGE